MTRRDKRVVITGGSGGIGRAMARRFLLKVLAPSFS
jgi:NAD(P)-dependent dehydrogenase (short-subunit alcohol dehydrogenase family)